MTRYLIDDTVLAIEDFPDLDQFVAHASARVFAHKIKLAGQIQEYYQSDLYWDVKLLETKVKELASGEPSVAWLWSVNTSGTTWHGTHAHPGSVRDRLYRFQLVKETRTWGDVIKLYTDQIEAKGVTRVNLV